MRARIPVIVSTVLALAAAAAPAAGQDFLRVPGDVPSLQQAIQRIAPGGVIELAPGVHPAPGGGFRIANLRKPFAVRSAPGGRAVLDGGGSTPILDVRNRDRASGGRLTFERLTFRDGFSAAESFSGAVTLHAAEARFVDCEFLDNETDAPTTGGGAVGVGNGSSVSFEGGAFRRNRARTRGGAIEVRGAEVSLHGTRLVANRVDLPGHGTNAVGGALYVINGDATVTDALFERNRAAWVGGAIYVFGTFAGPEGLPRSEVRVVGSTFRDNGTGPDPCCPVPGPTGGGAIHAEDRAKVTVIGSLFTGNEGRFGGAIQSFRAELEITGSVFRGNLAAETDAPLGLGGAVVALSSAGFEAGTPNRPPAAVTVRDSFFQGLVDGSAGAGFGGCLHASGDVAHLAGGRGGVVENRAPVELERVAFHRCRVETPPGVQAVGGAVDVALTDLDAHRVLFLDSATPAQAGGGGGLSVREESAAELSETTFAGNAAARGGAVFVSGGSRLDVADGRFFDNRVSPGASGAAGASLGAALFSIAPGAPPAPGRSGDVAGTVAGSLFAANVGVEVRDVEPQPGERNALRYDGNSFFSTTFGAIVYSHNLAAPGGLDVTGLNGLVVPGTPPIDKSVRPNTRLVSRPRAGDFLLVAPAGASGARSAAFAAFAWSGGQAVLEVPEGVGGDRQLPARHGVVELPDPRPGRYALRVDGVEVASRVLPEEPPPLPPGPFLSAPDLPGFRFKVQIASGATPIAGTQEADCIPETVCVSGALPGRSEVFLRVVGPKPNGFLQPTLVKFSTSRIRIWIEQAATGLVRYYELEPVGPLPPGAGALSILDGLIDRAGFLPAGAPATGTVSEGGSFRGGAGPAQAPRAEEVPPVPPGGRLTSADFPDFRFTVRISGGGGSRLGRKEPDCIPETLCVSGALPGRSEVFLRVVGPKPNGFLQPTLVTFSTSTLEVWIERVSSGALRYYRLEGVGPGSDGGLDGLIDREGFKP